MMKCRQVRILMHCGFAGCPTLIPTVLKSVCPLPCLRPAQPSTDLRDNSCPARLATYRKSQEPWYFWHGIAQHFFGSPVRGPVDFAQVWQPMLRVLTARNTVFVVCTAIVIHVAPRDTHPRSVPGRIGIIDQQRGTGVFQCKSCAKMAGTRLLTLRRNIFRRLNNNHCLVLDCPLSTTCPGCPQCATCQARLCDPSLFLNFEGKTLQTRTSAGQTHLPWIVLLQPCKVVGISLCGGTNRTFSNSSRYASQLEAVESIRLT